MAREPAISDVTYVNLPGQVWGLAAPGADGPVFATSYDEKNLSATVLTSLGLDGRVLWRRTFGGRPGRPRLRPSTSGHSRHTTGSLCCSPATVVATSRPGPGLHKAISSPGEFLIGFQGYGAFRTSRYDAAGSVVQEWPTHTMILIGQVSVSRARMGPSGLGACQGEERGPGQARPPRRSR